MFSEKTLEIVLLVGGCGRNRDSDGHLEIQFPEPLGQVSEIILEILTRDFSGRSSMFTLLTHFRRIKYENTCGSFCCILGSHFYGLCK